MRATFLSVLLQHQVAACLMAMCFIMGSAQSVHAQEKMLTDPRLTLKGHTSDLWSAAFSPTATRILTASSDKTAKLWEATSGTLIATLEGHTEGLRNAAFSPDGALIATVARDGLGTLWNGKTGAKLQTLTGHESMVEPSNSAATAPVS